eukprot:1879668-Rhodomonas_salina.1
MALDPSCCSPVDGHPAPSAANCRLTQFPYAASAAQSNVLAKNASILCPLRSRSLGQQKWLLSKNADVQKR